MVEKLSSLGVLLKSELCQKCSKFRMQICLGLLTNVLHVFFSLKFASCLRYYIHVIYVISKTQFPRASSGDALFY